MTMLVVAGHSNDSGIHVADATTGAVREVMHGGPQVQPPVSPDGRYVVFEQQPSQAGVTTALSRPPWLQVLDTQGGTIVDSFRRDGGISAHFVTQTQFWFQVPVHSSSPAIAWSRDLAPPSGAGGPAPEPAGVLAQSPVACRRPPKTPPGR